MCITRSVCGKKTSTSGKGKEIEEGKAAYLYTFNSRPPPFQPQYVSDYVFLTPSALSSRLAVHVHAVCVHALRPLIGRRASVTPRTRRVTRWPPQRHQAAARGFNFEEDAGCLSIRNLSSCARITRGTLGSIIASGGRCKGVRSGNIGLKVCLLLQFLCYLEVLHGVCSA
ncbi:hypothetical protein KUCAC02_031533, partial [Chaenocephalus aceratus]